MSRKIVSVVIALMVFLVSTSACEIDIKLTESATPPIALISDQSQLLSIQPILDSMPMGYDVFNDNWPHLYTVDSSLLAKYRIVILYKTGKFPSGQSGRELTYPEHSAITSYLSLGGNLLVTGSDSLGNPDDELLADVVRSSLMGNASGEDFFLVANATHPIVNGPYRIFPEGYSISGSFRGCDRAEADTARNAVTVAEFPDGNDKIIATQTASGKVVYWNGNGTNDWTSNDACQAMLKNTLYWFVPQEHELSVSLEVKDFLEPRQHGLLNATVHNFGLNAESKVAIQIFIDGVIKNSSVVSFLPRNTAYSIIYLWTPENIGNYNLTAYVPPVVGEVLSQNNIADKIYQVRIYPPVALISASLQLSSIEPMLDTMGIAYDEYGNNSALHHTGNADLLGAYDTVILYKGLTGITSTEYLAIKSYLSHGGNLLVTGFDSLLQDELLAEVVRSSSTGEAMSQDALYVRDGTHPIIKGPYGSFSAGYAIFGLVGDCDWAEADTARNAVTVAELANGNDKIIATQTAGGKVVYWNGDGINDWTTNVDCGTMFKNMMVWLTGIQLEHEVTIVLEAARVIEPNETVSFTATVYNPGLNNETNLNLVLMIDQTTIDQKTIPLLQNGTSYIYSLSWTPTYEGDYNLTGTVTAAPGEKNTANNMQSILIKVVALYTPGKPDKTVSILIVNDNDVRASAGKDSLEEFKSALQAMKTELYFVWNEMDYGRPPLSFLLKFRLVIWTCGCCWDYAVDSQDAETLRKYLEQGGNILLEGEDIGYDHSSPEDTFMNNVAHAIENADRVGTAGLTVTYPEPFLATRGLPQSFNWTTPPPYDDGVTPTNGGVGIISYTDSEWVAVTIFDGTQERKGCVVYYAFPLSCLNATERNLLVSASITWASLSGDLNGDGSVDIIDLTLVAIRFGNKRWP